jgi:hypothetical protein
MYNLSVDPAERNDVRTTEPERFAAMLETLRRVNSEVEKEGPDWWRRLDPDGGKAAKKKRKA